MSHMHIRSIAPSRLFAHWNSPRRESSSDQKKKKKDLRSFPSQFLLSWEGCQRSPSPNENSSVSLTRPHLGHMPSPSEFIFVQEGLLSSPWFPFCCWPCLPSSRAHVAFHWWGAWWWKDKCSSKPSSSLMGMDGDGGGRGDGVVEEYSSRSFSFYALFHGKP